MNKVPSRRFRQRAAGMVCALGLALAPCPLGAQPATTNAPSRATQPPAPRRPSILLILADNIGYGDLGCYGQSRIQTTNLDRLAAQGIRFTRFYAGSPEDAPSRAALLTGIEPRHAHLGFAQLLDPRATTLAAFLQSLNYRTGLIGEWGLGDTQPALPAQKGFDEFAGFLNPAHAREYYTDKIWRHDLSLFDGQDTIFENEGGRHGVYIPDLLTTAAINFIRINRPDRFNHYRPFFLCLAYPIPHPGAVPSDAPYDRQPWPQPLKDRAAMITRLDENIGRLLGALDQLQIATNTAVFFTSVGGPETQSAAQVFNSTGGLRGLAGSVFEGGIRVPMIARWPARIKAGRVSDFVWAGWDFFPTAARIALANPPPRLDGISILPVLTGKSEADRRELSWQSLQNGLQQAAALQGDWKLVRTNDAPAQLYYLKTDPGEQHNVAARNRGIVRQLEKSLEPGR